MLYVAGKEPDVRTKISRNTFILNSDEFFPFIRILINNFMNTVSIHDTAFSLTIFQLLDR